MSTRNLIATCGGIALTLSAGRSCLGQVVYNFKVIAETDEEVFEFDAIQSGSLNDNEWVTFTAFDLNGIGSVYRYNDGDGIQEIAKPPFAEGVGAVINNDQTIVCVGIDNAGVFGLYTWDLAGDVTQLPSSDNLILGAVTINDGVTPDVVYWSFFAGDQNQQATQCLIALDGVVETEIECAALSDGIQLASPSMNNNRIFAYLRNDTTAGKLSLEFSDLDNVASPVSLLVTCGGLISGPSINDANQVSVFYQDAVDVATGIYTLWSDRGVSIQSTKSVPMSEVNHDPLRRDVNTRPFVNNLGRMAFVARKNEIQGIYSGPNSVNDKVIAAAEQNVDLQGEIVNNSIRLYGINELDHILFAADVEDGGDIRTVLVIAEHPAVKTVFVDVSNGDPGGGLSWEEALNDLQDALGVATAGDEIWVAEGMYEHTDDNQTFSLVDGARILGGFPAGGGTLQERDPVEHVTTLNGNNVSRHVVTASRGVSEKAVLDGFTITGGNATGLALVGIGGGIHIIEASPTIIGCRFEANSAGWRGGAAFMGLEAGGAIAAPTFINCSFTGNTADNLGGAVFVQQDADPTFINCLFAQNSGPSQGGGALGRALEAIGGAIINCTFTRNDAPGQDAVGGALHNIHQDFVVTNCILWGNTANGAPDQIGGDDKNEVGMVSYSIVEGDDVWDGEGNLNDDPMFVDPDIDDFHLRGGSPAIDAGNNEPLLLLEIATDRDLNPRFVDDAETQDTGLGNLPLVDIGAYEFQVEPPEKCGDEDDRVKVYQGGDVNFDGDVDATDLILLLGAWGACDDCDNCAADFDGDCAVGAIDLIILLGNWTA